MKMKNVRKAMTVLIACVMLSGVLVGCGSSSSSSNYKAASDVAYADEAAYESYDSGAEMAMYEDNSAGSSASTKTTENATTTNRKLIRNASLTVETKEFDAIMASIDAKIKELGGYVENMNGYYGSRYESYRSNKNASITARIPSAKLDEFISAVGTEANIINRSESVTDVTLDYVDMESHKKMLIEEQNRLLEFLDRADTVEEIISLEDRLTNVKYQIDSMESQLRTYDNKVDYSTVTIDIKEVIDYTPVVEEEKTPGERMAEGFMESLRSIGIAFREFGVWFVINIPYILLLAIVAAVALLIIRFVNKKNSAKREAYKAAKKAREEEAAKNPEAAKSAESGSVYVNKPQK